MNHPDVLKAYSINTFLYIFKKDCLEISSRDIKWIITLYDNGIQWDVDKCSTPENVGIFMSPGSCKLDELQPDSLFYDQIKDWMDLKESL